MTSPLTQDEHFRIRCSEHMLFLLVPYVKTPRPFRTVQHPRTAHGWSPDIMGDAQPSDSSGLWPSHKVPGDPSVFCRNREH